METTRADMMSAESVKEVVEKILKLKTEIQRSVIISLYLWWGERCAVRGERLSTSQRAQIIRTYAEECTSLERCRTKPVSNMENSIVMGLSGSLTDLVAGGL
jgi:hypothetical protein